MPFRSEHGYQMANFELNPSHDVENTHRTHRWAPGCPPGGGPRYYGRNATQLDVPTARSSPDLAPKTIKGAHRFLSNLHYLVRHRPVHNRRPSLTGSITHLPSITFIFYPASDCLCRRFQPPAPPTHLHPRRAVLGWH